MNGEIRTEKAYDESHGPRPVLVLGIGNVLLSDEGIGVEVVRELDAVPLPGFVEIVDGGTSGADLIDVLAERKKIIIIDAMDAGAEPGDIAVFSPGETARPSRARLSLHDLGLVDTLRQTEFLGYGPDETVIIGVQPESLAPGTSISRAVRSAIPRVILRVWKEIRSFHAAATS
jgi:hydrogenase maturation protease